MSILKIGVILILFTIYAIVQFFIYHRFFDKVQFSLKLLIHAQSRTPYLSAIFNAYRGEIIEGGSIGSSNYGKFLNKIVSNFIMYYERMRSNENQEIMDKLALANYYSNLNDSTTPLNNDQLCSTISRIILNYDETDCKTEMNKIMNRGLKQSLSIILVSINMMHKSYKSEKNITNKILFEKYINDSLVLNLSILPK